MLRPDHLAAGESKAMDPDAIEKTREGRQPFRFRRIVHAVHAWLLQTLQGLGGGDVGRDHELFNQLVAVEAVARLDARDATGGIEQNPPLGNVEVERAARYTRALECAIDAVERLQDAVEQGRSLLVRLAVNRRLRFLVSQSRGG